MTVRSLKVALSYLRLTFSRELIFRSTTLLSLLTSLVVVIVTLIFFDAIYSRFDTIAGWSRGEALLLAGILLFILRLDQGLTRRGLTDLPHFIEMGKLEFILSKPVSAPFIIIFHSPDPTFIPRIFSGIFLMIYGILDPGLRIHPVNFLLFVISIFISFVLFVTLSFILNTLSFWFMRLYSLYWIVYDIADLGKYPAEIYTKSFRFLFTTFIPIIILANFPARILTGKSSPLLLIHQIAILVIFLLSARVLWKMGLKRYEGAGM